MRFVRGRAFRTLHLSGLLLAITSLLIAIFFMEGYLGLAVCPLCIIDRWLVGIAGILFALAMIHNPSSIGQRIYAGFNMLVCAVGVAVAGRHIWLQSLPPEEVPDCTPGLEYLMERFPLQKVFTVLIESAGECAELTWTFWGLSIPQQTLLLFITLFLIALVVVVKTFTIRSSRIVR